MSDTVNTATFFGSENGHAESLILIQPNGEDARDEQRVNGDELKPLAHRPARHRLDPGVKPLCRLHSWRLHCPNFSSGASGGVFVTSLAPLRSCSPA